MEDDKTNIFKPKIFSASVKDSGMNDFIFLTDLKQDTCSVSDECVKHLKIPSSSSNRFTKSILLVASQYEALSIRFNK